MIDLKLFFQEEERLKPLLLTRGVSEEDLLLLKDVVEKKRLVNKKLQELQAEMNQKTKELGVLKAKDPEGFQQSQIVLKKLKEELQLAEKEFEQFYTQELNLALRIPNIPLADTPKGLDETNNVVLEERGLIPTFHFPIKDHIDLGESLGLLNFEQSRKLSGARFSVLYGDLVKLERILIHFMMEEHKKMGFQEVSVPLLVREEALKGTGQLPKFKEDLFKIENHDFYLIPTAEVPLTNLYQDEHLENLPKRFVAATSCFRSEAGSYGKDTKGLIRQHQFYKVELMTFTTPEKSEEEFNLILNSACHILDLLELPYRLVRLCTGDLGFSSAKTIDLEVYLPSQKTYREISSVSLFTDFQARRMNTRVKEGGFVYTLNGSGLAVGRTLLAILENYQLEDGSIKVPKALRDLMGKKIITF